MVMFFLNAIVQVVLGIVFFPALNIWSQVGKSIKNVAFGIGFGFLSVRIPLWRCSKGNHL